MHPVEERQLLRELHRRTQPPPRIISGDGVVADVRRKLRARLFDKQLAFFDDPAKRKVARCSRRAGKTTETAIDEVDGCLEAAQAGIGRAKCLYATLTRERAKELLWPELKHLNEQEQLGIRFNEVELTATLPEALGLGVVKLTGADKAKEIEKRRGDKLKRARIDEAQAFGEYLRQFVDDVLEPALLDLQGDLGLLGTPGPVCAGLFFEASTGEAPGWSQHHWTMLDNPHIPHAREWLEKLKRERNWDDAHPTYRREWLGEWVNDAGALFYRYDALRNAYERLPEGPDWRYVMGVDLGFDDAFACVVWAFSRTTSELYEVDCFKASSLIPSQWAAHIASRMERYRPERVVVDSGGLGKAFVEELRQRHKLAVQPAEKQNKAAYVELLNGDLERGLVKVRHHSPLAEEWRTLPRDMDDPAKEDSRFANHAADAALYGWREALHFLGRREESGPKPGSPEWHAKRESDREERLAKRVRQRLQDEAEEADESW
jgi:hypothetical protein